MADKVTLDFENNTITWDTDAQKGVEYCPELSERKVEILAAMSYKPIDLAPAIKTFEALVNGKISEEEAHQQLADFVKDLGGA